IEAGDSQHVVGARRVYKVTVLVLPEFVAAPEPGADKGRAAFLAVVPVIRRTCRSAHLELADLAPVYRSPLLVHQAQLVTRHGLPGRSVAHISRPCAAEHVQHLGRTDALGAPVEPEEYSQKQGSSEVVGAGESSGEPFARTSSSVP